MHFLQIATPVFATLLTLFVGADGSPLNILELNREEQTLKERSGPMNPACTFYISYHVANQKVISEPPKLITGINIGPNPSGGTITAGYTYTKGVTFTGGISATFKATDVFTFGITATSYVTFTRGASISATQNCPGNVVCGLQASASLLQVDGSMKVRKCSPQGASANCPAFVSTSSHPTCTSSTYQGSPFNTEVPFTAFYPRIDKSAGLVDGQDAAIVNFRACTIGKGITGLDACPIITADNVTPPKKKTTTSKSSRDVESED